MCVIIYLNAIILNLIIKNAINSTDTLLCLINKFIGPEICLEPANLCVSTFKALIGLVFLHLQFNDSTDPIGFISKWLNHLINLNKFITNYIFKNLENKVFSDCFDPYYLDKIPNIKKSKIKKK